MRPPRTRSAFPRLAGELLLFGKSVAQTMKGDAEGGRLL